MRAGYFTVRKDADSDRTICSRVPQNSQLRRPTKLRGLIALGVQLCDIHLGPASDGLWVRFSLDDLPDMYHSCIVPREKAAWNAIGAPLDIAEVAEVAPKAWAAFQADVQAGVEWPCEEGVVQPAQNNLVMGDSYAVEEAQTAHMNVLRAGGVLPDESLLLYDQSFPRGDTLVGVVVDDLGIIQVVRPRDSRGPGDEELVAKVDPAYAGAGLAAKPSKRRRYQSAGVIWGADVDGVRGWVSADFSLMLRSAWATMWQLSLGVTDAAVWDALLGLWAHVLAFRRPGFCLLSAAYRVTEGVDRRRDPLLPSARAAQELLGLLAFLPLFGTDMRTEFLDSVLCTDASPWAGAGGEARVGAAVCQQMWRYRYRKNLYHRLDDPVLKLYETGGDEVEGDPRGERILREGLALSESLARASDDPETGPPWVNEFARACVWDVVGKWRLSPHMHINLKEAIAWQLLLGRLVTRADLHQSKVVGLLDSFVNIGAISKGRSPSRSLNQIMSRGLGNLLFGGVYPGVLHVGTKANPMDAPSRDAPARTVPGPPCHWLEGLRGGDAGEELARVAERRFPPPGLRANALS